MLNMVPQARTARYSVARLRRLPLPSLPLPERWRRLMARYVGAQEQHSRLVFGLQLVYLAVFLVVFFFGANEWPAAPDLITVALLGFAVLTARALRFLRDWTPFLALTMGYLALPGLAPGLTGRAAINFPIAVDRWFGRGEILTTRMQDVLWKGGDLQWYDHVAAMLYLQHFITPLILAFLFWQWRRPLYVRFVRAYIVLMYAGFTVYMLYPMAPPWWASSLGRIHPIAPILSLVHWKGIGSPVGILTGVFTPDPVAAMPSMHCAFSFFVWLVVWNLWPRRGWIAVIYPLAMASTVIYTGDHYLIDALVGWSFAVAVFFLVWRPSRERAPAVVEARRAAPAGVAQPAPGAPAMPVPEAVYQSGDS